MNENNCKLHWYECNYCTRITCSIIFIIIRIAAEEVILEDESKPKKKKK